jgi:methylated-DNA-[protein]-cysteine S-methyltransferase
VEDEMTVYYSYLDSSVGELLLASEGGALIEIQFPHRGRPRKPGECWRENRKVLRPQAKQLEQYFAGDREEFDVALDLRGTPFQVDVWNALLAIPYGETISYGELARRVRRPKAARAVGAANGKNPIPIIVPCHRVIGSDGTLTGFGGGLPTKKALLALERQGRGQQLLF